MSFCPLRFSLTNFTAVAPGCRADNRVVGVSWREEHWAAAGAASEQAEVQHLVIVTDFRTLSRASEQKSPTLLDNLADTTGSNTLVTGV